jgi:hypothetical protein
MIDANQDVPLTLTAGECNVILSLLSDAPYRVAAPLIGKLHNQIRAFDPTAFGDAAPPVAINGSAVHVSD